MYVCMYLFDAFTFEENTLHNAFYIVSTINRYMTTVYIQCDIITYNS